MNAVANEIRKVVTHKSAAKAFAKVTSVEEGVNAVREFICELLNIVPRQGNEGTFCGILAYLAEQRLASSSDISDIYDAEAMIHGALRSDDAEPGQVAILEVAAECIDQLSTLMDQHSISDAASVASAPAQAADAASESLETNQEPRFKVAREACFEVHDLAKAASLLMKNANTHFDGCIALRGMLIRFAELSDIIYEAGLQEDNEPTNDELNVMRVSLGLEEVDA